MYMEPDDLGSSAALRWPEPDPPDQDADGTANAEAAVAALYRAQAVGLIRLAYLMLGDRGAAEDVVQDAFCGLYWHWDRLADPAGALAYVRSPDGTQLAAAIGDSVLYAEHLYVFDLATGTKRAWTTRTCSQCVPTSGGMLATGRAHQSPKTRGRWRSVAWPSATTRRRDCWALRRCWPC